MTSFTKGMILCAAHVGLVASLGAKLLIDRATLPNIWVKTFPVDPDLPVRGRYVSLRISTAPRGFDPATVYSTAALSVEDGKLVSRPDDTSNVQVNVSDGSISEPLAFFIPEKGPDPSRVEAGQELWVEVTVPKRGPPRPVRVEARPSR
jgi:hypothetical protein